MVKDSIATRFDSAMSSIGFVYLINTGTNMNKIYSVYDATRNFFRSALHKKQAFITLDKFGSTGYHSVGVERQDKTFSCPDLCESYTVRNIGSFMVGSTKTI